MDTDQLTALLQSFRAGDIDQSAVIQRLRRLPFEKLDFATLDHHRAIRCGCPEVIFCPGKRPEHVTEIAARLTADGQTVLATRADDAQRAAVADRFTNVEIDTIARTLLFNPPPPPTSADHPVGLLCAGTADLPVAAEAAVTLRAMGAPAVRLNDVGVSGLHRLLSQIEILQTVCAVIVVAGMEGALPGVVGGLVDCPVFAVPTSVGYGAALGGLSAMLGMLNSCASNISTVNIDNGFGAAYSAALIHKRLVKPAK